MKGGPIRAGDIVTVQILVTEVADYSEEGQQVMGRMLPRGGQVGWLVPQEAKVTLHTQRINVGDEVWLDDAQSDKGTVQAVSAGCNPNQAWIKSDHSGQMVTLPLDGLRRVR